MEKEFLGNKKEVASFPEDVGANYNFAYFQGTDDLLEHESDE